MVCVCMFLQHASVDTHTHTHTVSSQCCYVLCEMTGLQQSPQDPHHCSRRTDTHSTLVHYAMGGKRWEGGGGREEVGGRRWEGEGWEEVGGERDGRR